MFKTFSALLVTILFTTLILIACQKQDAVKQSPTSKTNPAALARTDNKDYKIPEDTAIAWTTRWRAKNKTEFSGKMPQAFLLPINGINQLQIEAAEHGVQLSGIRAYLSVNAEGNITVMYVPADLNKEDILGYKDENNFSPTFPYYDGGEVCPPVCNFAPNVLNNSKEN